MGSTGTTLLAVLPLHLGALHPVEHALVWLLAFGPFVVLAFAVRIARRRDREEDAAAEATSGSAAAPGGEQTPPERRRP